MVARQQPAFPKEPVGAEGCVLPSHQYERTHLKQRHKYPPPQQQPCHRGITHTHTHTCVYKDTHTEPLMICVCVPQNQVVDSGSGLTQGDKLRALKSRRPPRYSTSGAVRYQIRGKRGGLVASHVGSGSPKPRGVFQVGGDGDPRQVGLAAPQVSCPSQRVKTLKRDPIGVANEVKSPGGASRQGPECSECGTPVQSDLKAYACWSPEPEPSQLDQSRT